MFINPDEYLLVMDTAQADLAVDELKMLADAGVQTIYRHAAIRWELCQPEPGAPFSWAWLDAYVERVRQAGLKLLIPFIYSIPPWKPDEFFHSREKVELAYGIPNYENPEVSEELDAMAREAVERYSADDCQVIYSIPANGEFPLHIWPRDGDIPFGIDVLVKWVVERQKIFEAEHGEVWTMYHPYLDPLYWRPVYDALFAEFPDSAHYGIVFTYVQHSRAHFKRCIKDNQNKGMIYYGGTEYIQGMSDNVPRLLGDNVRMFTSPTHPYQEYRTVEPWMIEEIDWALRMYENA